MQKILSAFTCFLILAFFSCKKDPTLLTDPNTQEEEPFVLKHDVEVSITNVVGSQPLTFFNQIYVNQNYDTFLVARFRYYISNIKLIREDSFIFVEPESYRLIDASDSSGTCKFIIKDVPVGNYAGMELIIGVDSLRNCDGAQTGALDPLNDMFWSWSQGYIFAKLEGDFKNGATVGGFIYHIGGFTYPNSAIVKSTPSFNGNMIQVTGDKASKLYLKADVLEWFKNPMTIDIAAYGTVMGGKKAKDLAVNYSDMFSVAAIVHE